MTTLTPHNIAEFLTSIRQELVSLSQRWLTVQEACRYAKMSRNMLMEHILNSYFLGRLIRNQ